MFWCAADQTLPWEAPAQNAYQFAKSNKFRHEECTLQAFNFMTRDRI